MFILAIRRSDFAFQNMSQFLALILVSTHFANALVLNDGVVSIILVSESLFSKSGINSKIGQTPSPGMELMECVRLRCRRDEDNDSRKLARESRSQRCRLRIREQYSPFVKTLMQYSN